MDQGKLIEDQIVQLSLQSSSSRNHRRIVPAGKSVQVLSSQSDFEKLTETKIRIQNSIRELEEKCDKHKAFNKTFIEDNCLEGEGFESKIPTPQMNTLQVETYNSSDPSDESSGGD